MAKEKCVCHKKKRMSKEEEEEDSDAGEEEEEFEDEDDIEIFVGLASSSTVQDQGDFFAKFGGSLLKYDCLQCKAKQTVVEACTVSAPFADLAKRQVIVCVCQSCNKCTVQRKQEKLVAATAAPPTKNKEEENKPLMFDESSSSSSFAHKETSMDELEALLLASTSLNKPKSKKPYTATTKKAPAVPSLHVAFYPEPGLEQEDFSHEAMLLAAYNKEAKELGEDIIELDRGALSSFETFFERLAREPQQLIRYAYGSKPLWPTTTTTAAVNIPPCETCHSARSFEFQLTPQAVSEFQRYSNNTTVEWSSILVFSCEASCDGGALEHCIVCPVI